jgi:hypothetical protein
VSLIQGGAISDRLEQVRMQVRSRVEEVRARLGGKAGGGALLDTIRAGAIMEKGVVPTLMERFPALRGRIGRPSTSASPTGPTSSTVVAKAGVSVKKVLA